MRNRAAGKDAGRAAGYRYGCAGGKRPGTDRGADGIPPAGAQAPGGGFTGTEQLKAEDGWRGGYYYADRTGDGRTEIINCCFESTRTSDETQEAYAGRCAAELSGAETAGFTAEKNAGHTERIAYPVYVLSWQTGQGGGARHWDALFFQTDTHTYMYAFNTEAAQAQEMHDTWMAAFSQLELTDR